MKYWECTVAVTHKPGYSNIPKTMRTQAKNLIEAKAYFQMFGTLLNEPRIVT